jgi:hypothetical protein
MQASYPQVLLSERALFKAETEYIQNLETSWINAIALQGFLLTDGLEAPTRPTDVDRASSRSERTFRHGHSITKEVTVRFGLHPAAAPSLRPKRTGDERLNPKGMIERQEEFGYAKAPTARERGSKAIAAN